MKNFPTPEQALSRLAALCARSEQCSSDIEKKLEKMHLQPGDARRIMERLKELKFVDDERFARAYAHDKLEYQLWGRMKISRGLWAKRIPRDLIDDALDNLDPDIYRNTAARVVASKMRQLGDEAFTREGRDKILRFAMGRGFEAGLVIKILSYLIKKRLEESRGDDEMD
ncbi:MAG: RecX family transcriptional regulator [Duncaniella sp.]|nr:RecX family transcriptional regulator [Duncaniella sp.]